MFFPCEITLWLGNKALNFLAKGLVYGRSSINKFLLFLLLFSELRGDKGPANTRD